MNSLMRSCGRNSLLVELAILDTSVISALYALGCFEQLKQLASKRNWELAIPHTVAEELSKHSEFQSLERDVPLKIFQINNDNLSQMKNRFPALADGELAVLLLALNYSNFRKEATSAFAILDDRASRNAAKKIGIRYFGTLKLLYEMLKENFLTKSQFKQCIRKLRDSGFYFSECILEEIIGSDF